MSRGWPALLLLAAPPVASAPQPGAQAERPAFERAVEVGHVGRVAAHLDREVYESARPDLGDLRVIDDTGRLVPFLIDRGEGPALRSDASAALRNQGWAADGSATAVLDFGGRLRKSRLRLALSGDNFRRRVSVEASDDGSSWSTIVDEAWVFAVPGADAGRYETVALPENDFPLLRLTVHPGEGERGRVRVEGGAVAASAEPLRREESLRPQWTRAEDAASRETWLTLDLGARHRPFRGIELEVADQRFFREARVEARQEPLPGQSRLVWTEIGRGAIHRLDHDGRRRECLTLDVAGRERALRVRLHNGDDRPLDVRGVTVRAPIERVVFEAVAGRSYRLAYGSREPAPAFDLARTVSDADAWTAAAADVALGAARHGARAEEPVPWSERHPALLWGGLLAVVAALGLLTLRALRQLER